MSIVTDTRSRVNPDHVSIVRPATYVRDDDTAKNRRYNDETYRWSRSNRPDDDAPDDVWEAFREMESRQHGEIHVRVYGTPEAPTELSPSVATTRKADELERAGSQLTDVWAFLLRQGIAALEKVERDGKGNDETLLDHVTRHIDWAENDAWLKACNEIQAMTGKGGVS